MDQTQKEKTLCLVESVLSQSKELSDSYKKTYANELIGINMFGHIRFVHGLMKGRLVGIRGLTNEEYNKYAEIIEEHFSFVDKLRVVCEVV